MNKRSYGAGAALLCCAVMLGSCGGDGPTLEEQIALREAALAETESQPTTAEELYTPLDTDTKVSAEIVEEVLDETTDGGESAARVEVVSVQPGRDGQLDLDQFAGVETVAALSRAVDDNRTIVTAVAAEMRGLRESFDALELRMRTSEDNAALVMDTGIAPHEVLPPTDMRELYIPERQWQAELRHEIRLIEELGEAARLYAGAIETFRENRKYVAMLSRMHPELQGASDGLDAHLEIYADVMGEVEEAAPVTRRVVRPQLLFTDGTTVMVAISGVNYTTSAGQKIQTPDGPFEVVTINNDGSVEIAFNDELQEISI